MSSYFVYFAFLDCCVLHVFLPVKLVSFSYDKVLSILYIRFR
jgi:hypothetical protein